MNSLVKLRHHDGKIPWPRYEILAVSFLAMDATQCNAQAPRVGNLLIDNLRFYPLGRTTASWDIMLSVFPTDSAAGYVVCEHRTNNFASTIQQFNKLSYTASVYKLISIYK